MKKRDKIMYGFATLTISGCIGMIFFAAVGLTNDPFGVFIRAWNKAVAHVYLSLILEIMCAVCFLIGFLGCLMLATEDDP
jgi:hypothetical protein